MASLNLHLNLFFLFAIWLNPITGSDKLIHGRMSKLKKYTHLTIKVQLLLGQSTQLSFTELFKECLNSVTMKGKIDLKIDPYNYFK
jgi:hypothetical protein